MLQYKHRLIFMTESEIKIKLSYITGLEPVVFEELEQFGFQALD